MAHTLTPSGTYAANVTVPDPGDPRTAASVETPFQELCDRTDNHQTRLGAAETAITLLKSVTPGANTAASIALAVPLNPAPGTEADWLTPNLEFSLSDASTGSVAYFDLASVLPRGGGKIQTIAMTLQGTGTHGAGEPATKPKLELYRKDNTSGATSLRLTATDATASAAFDAVHSVQATLGTPESIAGFSWWLKLTGEGGAGADINLALHALTVSVVPS